MDSLTDYFSKQDEIVELKAKIVELEKRVKLEIVELEKRVRRELQAKSKYKRLWENLRGKQTVRESRCEKARKVIAKRHSGEIEITLKEIAETHFLGYINNC